MKPLVYHAEAEAEFLAAIAYYDGQRDGLGEEFEAEVERTTRSITDRPQTFPRHGTLGYRRGRLARFPYTIYFLELDEVIWVAAVAHQRRRPNDWAGRTPG